MPIFRKALLYDINDKYIERRDFGIVGLEDVADGTADAIGKVLAVDTPNPDPSFSFYFIQDLVGDFRAYWGDESTLSQRFYATDAQIVDGFDYNDDIINHGWSIDTTDFSPINLGIWGDYDAYNLDKPSLISFFLSGNNNKYFIYKNSIPTGAMQILAGFALRALGAKILLRVDDGTNNNYAQNGIVVNASGNFQFYSEYRVGGGAVQTSYGSEYFLPTPLILKHNFAGTKWSSWYSDIWWSIPSIAPLISQKLDIRVGPFAWTPARHGIVLQAPSSNIAVAFIDVFYNNI